MTLLSKSALCAFQSWNVKLEEFHAAGHVILLVVLQPLLIDSSNCISKFGTLATQDTLLCSPLSFDDLLMSLLLLRRCPSLLAQPTPSRLST